ncbi:testis-expressed protein 264 [Chanos chanos]|uniref:Testis-expressed protein 264 n=1 Tax=Chanos chanos TaxID=29144 RepID=A0A6J2VM68_CHACN|nr:testis-expressed protein 264 [Chanos chanos]
MSELWILSLIGIFIISLFLTVLGYVLYSGLLSEVTIGTGSPPIKNITIAYKFTEGPYKDCGALFTESCSIGPKLPSIGIFYDDPKKVPAQKCRYAVGSILSEGPEKPCEEQQRLFEKFGFRIFSFPEVTHVVATAFPHRTPLSIFLGVQRVYPQLSCYIKERKLCAHPFLEIYKGDLIHYMSPLARQGDFYVPEVRQAESRLTGEEESEEDGRTDITGADSNSECSSMSRLASSDSRDSSPAVSIAPSLLRRDWEDRDTPGRMSDRSSSHSSFEELDMEMTDRPGEEDVTLPQPPHDKAAMEEREMVVEGEE